MGQKLGAVGTKQVALGAQVERAEQLKDELVKLLEKLGKEGNGLSQDVAWTLRRTAQELSSGYGIRDGAMSVTKAIGRAGDELNICSPTRVDADKLDVPHGVVVLFRCFDAEAKRQTTEEDKLIARFMKDHANIEVRPNDTPWGARDSFTIEGQKKDRLAFVNDPRWPKLQNALNDIYMAEHLPGVPSERPKRKIDDTMKYVFGR